MASWLSSLVNAVLCLFLLSLMPWEAATDSVARPSGFVRQGRSLTFPYGFGESYLEFTFGVGLPMNLPSPYQVSMSLEMRADYKYPVNASDFTNPTKRREDEEKEKEEMEEKKREKLKGSTVKKIDDQHISADVIASDFTNPTKRHEDEEKEKKQMEKKAKLNGSTVTNNDDQHSSANVTQTRANGNAAKIGDKKLNDTDTLNSTVCPDRINTHNGKLKLMTNKDGSNITTANSDDVTKGGCHDTDLDYLNSLESGRKDNKPGAEKKGYLEKSLLSEFEGIAGNFTTRSEYVDINAEDFASKNKTAKENIHDENINSEDVNERDGGARFIRKRDTGGRSTRWRIYHVLEMAANNLGMDGRACLLRSICEAASTPLHHRSNELVGELLHVLFTPSTSEDDRGRHLDNEYRAAEQLGSDVGNSCELLYPECDVSFLDLITTFELF